jgi:hypothetical protein
MNPTNDFFGDDNYKIPETSKYMKFKEGENNFRVLSSAITGYEYFNSSNKPVRSRTPFDETPDIKEGGQVKHFWAFVVWNYDAGIIQILELTQTGIMKYIQSLIKNPKWGSPKGYDLTVNRTGAGLNTEYTTVSSPHSALPAEIMNSFSKDKINLNALFENGDPFTTQS